MLKDKYIVTHPGTAHRDEFLSICCLLADKGLMAIERREPYVWEFKDKDVFIIDVGRRYEPEYHNFDHHQLNDGNCALTLMNRHYGWRLEVNPWYDFTALLDTQGSQNAYRKYGLKSSPALFNPIEVLMLTVFGSQKRIDTLDDITKLMYSFGKDLLRKAEAYEGYKTELQYFSYVETVKNKRVLVVEDFKFVTHELFNTVSLELARLNKCDVICSPSYDRNDMTPNGGWTGFRVDNGKGTNLINFSRLSESDKVRFTHSNGFLVLTKNMKRKEALKLMSSIW